jgi:hypothetical protein
MGPANETIPRETRLRLNKMERWFRANTHRYTPADQVFIRYGFDIAEKAADADILGEMLRDGLQHHTLESTTV